MTIQRLLAGTQPLLEQLAAFTERRHDVLAGNLANISTPGYEARDLPVERFQAALRTAIEAGSASDETTGKQFWTSSDITPTSAFRELVSADLHRSDRRDAISPTYQDGATRSIEQELMELTKNSMTQQYAVELLAAQFNKLQMVISERA
jgi:flagellar basal-body rod protein FlgB